MKTLNSQKDSSIVIVTTAFYPENAIGAVRLTYLAKNLSSFYKQITVICPSETNILNIDSTLNITDISNISILRINNFYLFEVLQKFRDRILSGSKGSELLGSIKNSKKKKSLIKSFAYNFFLRFYTHAKNLNFFLKSFILFRSIKKKHSFEILISSYPSYSSHLAALFIKKQIPEIFWVADFRDPMVYPSLGDSKLLSYIQQKSLVNADLITVISNGVKDMICQSIKNDNVKVLHNGFDELPRFNNPQILNKENINFTYSGSLYGGKRDLSIFFKFLHRFLKENEHYKNSIRVNYAGSDFNSIKKIAVTNKLDSYLIDHGKVDRLSSLQMQYESDFILVATWNTISEQGILTGKVFEALMLNKKIVATISGDKENSELKELIDTHGAGIALESNFIDSKDYFNFSQLILSSSNNSLSFDDLQSNHPFKKFHFSELSKKLISYIELLK